MDVKGCPIAKAPQVTVPLEMYNIWTDLADRKDTEWIAYLIGTLDQDAGKATITEMYFPPQTVGGAHVEVPDEIKVEIRPGTIAAVHSHVKMQAFFSKTDEDHANWPVEIVINAKGESVVRMRMKLKCGEYSRVDGKILLTGVRASDLVLKDLEAAIVPEKKAETVATFDGSHEGYHYGEVG